jgi:hypothetical protein
MNTAVHDQNALVNVRLALAAGAALLGAGVILVTCVLPAEYGVDPLGTGARLGLLDLGVVGQQVQALEAAKGQATSTGVQTVAHQNATFKQETVTFPIAAHQGMEYKYRLNKGDAMLYSWKATTPVNYELHAEPDGAPRGYAQSYEKRSATAQDSGTLTAPFPGIHGWYWENPSDQDITVTLTSAGYYTLSHEFRAGAPVKNKTF